MLAALPSWFSAALVTHVVRFGSGALPLPQLYETPTIPKPCAGIGKRWCNRVIASPITALAPEPHQQCPGGTAQSSNHQEVSIYPDIGVNCSALTGQKVNTEDVKAHDSRKPEEARS
ncbi:hypothetical protein NDU88_005324 [Pleurodeles waltl]|uniref:Secreted protein n=1 Tax=Pleurodeles waltl TaxID=8319 RepID=A0AAV7X0V5_PLEWA|nr:hypothetical protein NDU88_005324 [Pleurodeles waltl]